MANLTSTVWAGGVLLSDQQMRVRIIMDKHSDHEEWFAKYQCVFEGLERECNLGGTWRASRGANAFLLDLVGEFKGSSIWVFFGGVPGIEFRASCLLGKCSTT
jgi:hypothetical protein